MKPALVIFLHFFVFVTLHGQSIQGRVLDSNTGEAIEYVSIGVLHTRIGTITDENGEYNLMENDLSPDSILRISFIGYESQTFSLGEFQNESRIIQMLVKPVRLGRFQVWEGKRNWNRDGPGQYSFAYTKSACAYTSPGL